MIPHGWNRLVWLWINFRDLFFINPPFNNHLVIKAIHKNLLLQLLLGFMHGYINLVCFNPAMIQRIYLYHWSSFDDPSCTRQDPGVHVTWPTDLSSSRHRHWSNYITITEPNSHLAFTFNRWSLQATFQCVLMLLVLLKICIMTNFKC